MAAPRRPRRPAFRSTPPRPGRPRGNVGRPDGSSRMTNAVDDEAPTTARRWRPTRAPWRSPGAARSARPPLFTGSPTGRANPRPAPQAGPTQTVDPLPAPTTSAGLRSGGPPRRLLPVGGARKPRCPARDDAAVARPVGRGAVEPPPLVPRRRAAGRRPARGPARGRLTARGPSWSEPAWLLRTRTSAGGCPPAAVTCPPDPPRRRRRGARVRGAATSSSRFVGSSTRSRTARPPTRGSRSTRYDLMTVDSADPLGNRTTVGDRDGDQPPVRPAVDYRVLQADHGHRSQRQPGRGRIRHPRSARRHCGHGQVGRAPGRLARGRRPGRPTSRR